LARGDVNEAISDFSDALDRDPRLARAYAQRGKGRLACRDLKGAIADCDRAVELDPRMAEAFATWAYAHLAGGDVKGALADHARATELGHAAGGPLRALALRERGAARRRQRDLDGAL